MKKIVIVFISLLVICSTAIAETEFSIQEMPWLSDKNESFQWLKQAKLVQADETMPLLSTEASSYIIVDDVNCRPGYNKNYDNTCYSLSLKGLVEGRIAGYPINNIILSYAYDGEYKLISAKIELIGADYSAMKEKLNKKYGEGEQTITEEGIDSIVWRENNKIAILLYTENDGIDYVIMYGRLDAEDILLQCLAISDPEDISGL